jgi:hypothetical protein
MLWHFASEFAITGDVGRFDDVELCAAMGWEGDADQLISALTDLGWIDKVPGKSRFAIHDWHEHADDYTKKKIKGSGTVCACCWKIPENSRIFSPALPCQTVPDRARPETKTAPPSEDFEAWFERQYARHPNKRDKTPSARLAAVAFSEGKFALEEFEARHVAWCQTETWTWKNGARAPRSLGEWISDEGYRYDPRSAAAPTEAVIPPQYNDPNRYKLGN